MVWTARIFLVSVHLLLKFTTYNLTKDLLMAMDGNCCICTKLFDTICEAGSFLLPSLVTLSCWLVQAQRLEVGSQHVHRGQQRRWPSGPVAQCKELAGSPWPGLWGITCKASWLGALVCGLATFDLKKLIVKGSGGLCMWVWSEVRIGMSPGGVKQSADAAFNYSASRLPFF